MRSYSAQKAFMGNVSLPKIEVAYATPESQTIVELNVEQGISVREAIEMSGLAKTYPGLTVAEGLVGIFSKKVPLDYILMEGDRVEIYRELILSPKEARRLRALNKKR